MVSKYLKKVIDDINFDKHLDLILEYIHERSFDFIEMNYIFVVRCINILYNYLWR